MKTHLSSQGAVDRHIAKGHGKGEGPDYQPWMEVRHISSKGKASRVLGWKTGRMHSLHSQLELRYFYTLEWAEHVVDIREQFPLLPRSSTEEICDTLGIGHPMEVGATLNKVRR
jgi:hypothetical protein